MVSALAQPMSDLTFRPNMSRERNYPFHTAIGTTPLTDRNTISACAYQSDGYGRANGTFPSLEPMSVSGKEIPRNTSVVGGGEVTGRTPEHYHLFGVSGKYHSRGAGGMIRTDRLGYSSPARWKCRQEIVAEWVLPQAQANISTDGCFKLAADLGKGLIQGEPIFWQEHAYTRWPFEAGGLSTRKQVQFTVIIHHFNPK